LCQQDLWNKRYHAVKYLAAVKVSALFRARFAGFAATICPGRARGAWAERAANDAAAAAKRSRDVVFTLIPDLRRHLHVEEWDDH
jgi:hypothetical protein